MGTLLAAKVQISDGDWFAMAAVEDGASELSWQLGPGRVHRLAIALCNRGQQPSIVAIRLDCRCPRRNCPTVKRQARVRHNQSRVDLYLESEPRAIRTGAVRAVE